MKKLLAIIVVTLIAIPVFSQIKFGIKAGAESMTTPDYTTSGTSNITAMKNAAWGFHAGIFTRITVLGVYLQPEIVFATTSFDYNITSGTNPGIKTQKFNRLQIPVLVGIKLGPIRINAGPAALVQIGSPDALTNDANFKDMYKSATFGYQAGLGFDLFKKLTFDARFAGGLGQKFGDSATVLGQNYKLDYGQTSFLLSLGFMF